MNYDSQKHNGKMKNKGRNCNPKNIKRIRKKAASGQINSDSIDQGQNLINRSACSLRLIEDVVPESNAFDLFKNTFRLLNT